MQSFSHSTCTKEARHKCASGDREANSTRCPSRKPALCPTTSAATSTAASIATSCAATAGAGSASPPDATAATNCLASAPAAPTAAAGPRTYAQPTAAAISACPQCAPSHSRHDVAAQKQGYVVSVVAGCVSASVGLLMLPPLRSASPTPPPEMPSQRTKEEGTIVYSSCFHSLTLIGFFAWLQSLLHAAHLRRHTSSTRRTTCRHR
jgi:hypothetical protein